MTDEKNSSENSTRPDRSLARPEAHAPDMPLVTVIGDGQLARMMQQAGIELGLTVRLLAGSGGSSAAQATADVWLGEYTEEQVVREISSGADAVTFDHEHVPNDYLEALIAEGVNVQPQPSALINAQDKLVMRKKMREIGAPVPPFLEITSVDDATGFFDATDGAVCLKARRGGYDGKGVWFPDTREETATLVADLLEQGVPLMAEQKVRLVRELSAMVARTPSGEVEAWPVVESVQADGICYLAVAPAPVATEGQRRIVEKAGLLARQVAADLGVTGVLAVELFETQDEAGQPEIIVNELAMRPHNTGHWTQDGCVTSQFEQHLRAVLDRPLGSSAPTASTTVMANVLGDDASDPEMPMPQRMDEVWRRFPTAKIHLYGKDWRPRRKIGHVNMSLPLGVDATEEAVEALRRDARLASDFLVGARWTDGWSA
ncbi:MAG TPA: 5-(carboxyamino)imidazole ribonucleotide synthase [Candidatus Corynebacterium avicola]|uniref:N5-carboxyaminoimidazole ribonucleotide synthase n=1 Tax=Candidatus Corynebacterium avicola TaxID=2838527 RepID=A0A9D1RRG5_9CORY|nr:5-(carboxyamino)imidazole ribonucleotide synthase [Candidatus Corynebacterium avicola]